MKIKNIKAREILDSRGTPTVETTVELDDGSCGTFGVPSGASTGKYEAWELRDGDEKRYFGKGVLKACENVNVKILEALKGKDAEDQKAIDQTMNDLDGDANKKNLGANAILSVSIANAKAVSSSKKLPLYKYLRGLFDNYYKLDDFKMPTPMFNVINGGAHADNNLDVQEFMAIPIGASNIIEAVRMGAEVFHKLGSIMKKKKLATNVGDEGGFAPSIDSGYAPNLDSDEEALALLREAIEKSGYKFAEDVAIGSDIAAAEFFKSGKYEMTFSNELKKLSTDEMVNFLKKWIDDYKLILVEDGFADDDLEGWKRFTELVGDKVQVVGDDFLVTNKERLQMAIDNKACNTVLIKVNQIGTLTETFETVALAYENDMKAIVSHRSGETADAFIADLSVAINADKMKSGAPSRGERVCKYNRLMAIKVPQRREDLLN
ncbi:MAG: hypothetical protein ACD_63C00023G0011 [uncultured bacterium]|nr:MAG: hypothetical protein ACD_63C00023G0011 [uncultured bacterium]